MHSFLSFSIFLFQLSIQRNETQSANIKVNRMQNISKSLLDMMSDDLFFQAVLEQHVMVLMKEAISGRLGGRSGGRGSKSN